METLIGVFASRERAEQAVTELIEKHVPQAAIFSMVEPGPTEASSEETKFSGEIPRERPSFIFVRTDQQEIAKVAAGILDRIGISAQWRMGGRIKTASRQIGGISIVDVQGVSAA